MFTQRYYLLAQYDFRRLDNTSEGGEIIDINERIRAHARHTLPLMEETYRNLKLSERRRHAAALALIQEYRAKAEKIFLEYMRHKEEAIVADAILHLGINHSRSAYQEVIGHFKSPNPDIRKSVASYLGDISDMPEAKQLLAKMIKTDPDTKVRNYAKYCQWLHRPKGNAEKSEQ